MEIKICPSILSADFSKLGDECREVLEGGAEWIHYDVMDGDFVPNISIGIPVLKTLSRAVGAFYDVHLMIRRPADYAEAFVRAGASMVTFHLESDCDPEATLDLIHSLGARAGVVLKPSTPAIAAFPFMHKCDMVLIMTVEPGFGGQSFMEDMLPKVREIREYADSMGRKDLDVEVDGGIDPSTAPLAAAAGANAFVAGSSVFGKADRAGAIEAIREAALSGSRKELNER